MERMLNLKTGISTTFKVCLLLLLILVPICCTATGNYKAVSVEVSVGTRASEGAPKPAKTSNRLLLESKPNVKLLAHNRNLPPLLLLRAPNSNTARVCPASAETARANHITQKA